MLNLKYEVDLYFNCFSILIAHLYGQDLNLQYGDSNSVWIYNYSVVPAVTRVKTIGDTIVGGRQLKVLEKTQFVRESSGEISVFPLPPLYVHTKAGIVEFSTDLVHIDTLYNFQLAIGESWTISRRDNSRIPTGQFLKRTVVDTFRAPLLTTFLVDQKIKNFLKRIKEIHTPLFVSRIATAILLPHALSDFL